MMDTYPGAAVRKGNSPRLEKRGLKSASISKQGGAVAITVAGMMTVLLGFAALAIDGGHLFVVRNELQNAADAAALAGTDYLYRPGTTPGNDYDWTSAETHASVILKENSSNGALLTDGDISTGYWNISSNTFNALPHTPANNDVPAVKVTASKVSGKNGGPVQHYLAPVLGINSSAVSATAIAVMAAPNTITPGGLLPLVVSTCIYNASWDFTKNPPKPKLGADGKPITWSFGPGMSGSSSCGDQSLYTSFAKQISDNDSDAMKKLLASGNPASMGIGDNTYVLGQADSISKTLLPMINQCSASNPNPSQRTCEYSTVGIVSKTDGAAGNQKIVSFACLHILSAHADSSGNYYISAQLSTLCQNNYSGGISQPNSVYRVRLVQ